MADTDLAAWLPIVDAARMIGCSTRTVERLGRARKLEQRLRRQEGTPPVAVYNPDDVARVAQARQREAAPFVLPAVPRPGNGNGHGSAGRAIRNIATSDKNYRGDDPIRQLAAAFQAFLLSPPSPPSPPVSASVAERPVLALDEAVAASGWSRTYLLRQIHNKRLPAEKDRGWKIRRRDLELL